MNHDLRRDADAIVRASIAAVLPDAAVRRALEGDVSPLWQASILRTHPDVIFLLDQAAASRLTRR